LLIYVYRQNRLTVESIIGHSNILSINQNYITSEELKEDLLKVVGILPRTVDIQAKEDEHETLDRKESVFSTFYSLVPELQYQSSIVT
jgi:hypothetical protein